MEFHERLQELRRQRGLTQEELAAALFVSRTAVSKWESGRGYPAIDSLKAIAAYFEVTVDALLSGDALLQLAEADRKRQKRQLRCLTYGLLDVLAVLYLLLPLFRQEAGDMVQAVSLLHLVCTAAYLKSVYFAVSLALVLLGVLALALQNHSGQFWLRCSMPLSLTAGIMAALLFTVSMQPYAAVFSLLMLAGKVFLLVKMR